jgi:hypothetical protein
MDAQTLAIFFRGGERLCIVMVAALCIWLGYKLFQSLPAQHGSGGTLTLPSTKLVMSKVGPGVFFALFGGLVLWESVQTQLKAGPVTTTAGLADARQITLAAASADPQALIYAKNDISVLNCLAGFAPGELGPGEAERVLHKARVSLLAPVWQPDWGEAAFAALERGQIPASGPIADIYRARNHACPPAGGPKG